jgi:radical SAM protein with 4Fe4S-binding SPASM domain
MGQITPVAKRFKKVYIEISNVCNLQCTFCPEVERPKMRMAPDDFRRVVDQVAPLTRMVALHLMGDPLMHPQLDALVEICRERGVQIFLVTNGVLLRRAQADVLLRPTFRQISFSLHSFADNFPRADPTPYLQRIFEFTERAFREQPRLFINYRLWNLAETRGREQRNQRVLEAIERRFQIALPRELDVDTKKNHIVKNRLSLHFDTEFIWPSLDLPEKGVTGTCQGLRSHIGILVDGTVVPCCLDKEGAISLGNIHEHPLAEILAGARACAVRKGFRENRLVEPLCRRCQYIERFSSAV